MLCGDVSKAVSCVLCGEKLEIGDWRLGEEPAGGEAGSVKLWNENASLVGGIGK